MNEFFKYLIPQLLKYFNNDEKLLEIFIPKVIEKNYKDTIQKLENKN